MHVAFVGGGEVHRQRAEQAVAGLLEDYGAGGIGETEAAEPGAHLRREQPGGAGFRVQLAAQLVVRAVPVLTRVLLGGQAVVADEGAGAVLQLGEGRGKREIDHCASLGPSRRRGEGDRAV